MKLHFAQPQVTPEGKSNTAATHLGMKPLMDRMAKILREQTIDYQAIMDQAVEELAREVSMDADAFTAALNAVRSAMSLPPLVSAEGETAEAIEAAVRTAQAQWADGERGRMLAAIEADRAERPTAGEVGGFDGDPPLPRGATARKARV